MRGVQEKVAASLKPVWDSSMGQAGCRPQRGWHQGKEVGWQERKQWASGMHLGLQEG